MAHYSFSYLSIARDKLHVAVALESVTTGADKFGFVALYFADAERKRRQWFSRSKMNLGRQKQRLVALNHRFFNRGPWLGFRGSVKITKVK